jgi:hypothetical protein
MSGEQTGDCQRLLGLITWTGLLAHGVMLRLPCQSSGVEVKLTAAARRSLTYMNRVHSWTQGMAWLGPGREGMAMRVWDGLKPCLGAIRCDGTSAHPVTASHLELARLALVGPGATAIMHLHARIATWRRRYQSMVRVS